jgi:hypothetical protein
MDKSKKTKKQIKINNEECVLPEPISLSSFTKLTLGRVEHEEREVREYVEWQFPDKKVIYLEKIKTERVLGREIDCWDVRTNDINLWVLTNPTNLYSQEDFQSLDYLLSFHIGLAARIYTKPKSPVNESEKARLLVAWRRWEQAAEAFDNADEAEEFQAVGMRCRECLILLVRSIANDSMIPEGQEPPKKADFPHWSELISQTITKGDRIRSYLKAISKSTWELVNWLTHAQNAVRMDGELVVYATQNVLAAFSTLLIKHERGLPDRCPDCNSYKITSVYSSDIGSDITLCERCGWAELDESKIEER